MVGSFVEGKLGLGNPSESLVACVEAVDEFASSDPLSSWGSAVGRGMQAAPGCRSAVAQLRDAAQAADDAGPASVTDDLVRHSDDLVRPATELTILGELGTHVRTSLWDDLLEVGGRAIQIATR